MRIESRGAVAPYLPRHLIRIVTQGKQILTQVAAACPRIPLIVKRAFENCFLWYQSVIGPDVTYVNIIPTREYPQLIGWKVTELWKRGANGLEPNFQVKERVLSNGHIVEKKPSSQYEEIRKIYLGTTPQELVSVVNEIFFRNMSRMA